MARNDTPLVLSAEDKWHVFTKYGNRCAYCGDFLNPFAEWHIDHFIPRAAGGSNDLDNLMPSCRRCNLQKRDYDINTFKEKLRLSLLKGIDDMANQAYLSAGIPEYEARKAIVDCLYSAMDIAKVCKFEFHYEVMESIWDDDARQWNRTILHDSLNVWDTNCCVESGPVLSFPPHVDDGDNQPMEVGADG